MPGLIHCQFLQVTSFLDLPMVFLWRQEDFRFGMRLWLVLSYIGSLEFLMVPILQSAFNPASVFVTAILVGARHIFYGISMLSKYKNTGIKKFYLIYTCSDETFSVNYSIDVPEYIDKSYVYFWVSSWQEKNTGICPISGELFGASCIFNACWHSSLHDID